MPRQPRYVLPGVPQHIIYRGNNRGRVFFEDQDYRCYLKWLKEAVEKYECNVHAYVLMTNHIHLLVTPVTADGLSKALQSLNTRYVQYVNRKYDRVGTLWQGKHKQTLVDSERYLFACYRYIELNPVRAGMVSDPGDYSWSSYRFHALGQANPLIRDHSLFLQMGQSGQERQCAYRTMFEETLDDNILKAIREATNKSWVLGSETFKTKMESLLRRRVRPMRRGRKRKSTIRVRP